MKTKLLSILSGLLFFTTIVNAQTSDMGFSFQGYAIDPDGKAIGSAAITVKFTLTPGTFTEEHSLTTDAFGVFTAIVGNSSLAKKTEFSKLDFTKKSTVYSLKVEVKKTSGGTYTTISNAVMNAVPYARHAANGVPVGSIIAYGGDKNNVPAGWKLCDGASVLKTDYPQLYAAVGNAWGTSGASFNMPDLRGRFLRGVSGTSTNDPNKTTRTIINAGGNTGNNVGTAQGDDNKQHNHSASSNTTGNHTHNIKKLPYDNNGTGVSQHTLVDSSGDDENWGNVHTNPPAGSLSTDGNHSHTITVANSGSESRPKNAGVYYIIKY